MKAGRITPEIVTGADKLHARQQEQERQARRAAWVAEHPDYLKVTRGPWTDAEEIGAELHDEFEHDDFDRNDFDNGRR